MEIKQKVISYSRKDIKFARRLATDLESAGFDLVGHHTPSKR